MSTKLLLLGIILSFTSLHSQAQTSQDKVKKTKEVEVKTTAAKKMNPAKKKSIKAAPSKTVFKEKK